jgi:hypothetical protein
MALRGQMNKSEQIENGLLRDIIKEIYELCLFSTSSAETIQEIQKVLKPIVKSNNVASVTSVASVASAT